MCDVSTSMLGVAGLDGRVRWVNPAFEATLGYSLDEMLAMPSYMETVHPDDRDSIALLLGSLAESGIRATADVRMRHRDGSWRLCRSSIVGIDDVVYFSGTDLTEDLRRAEDLSRANASLQLFGAGVAHDLRSLLTIIEGTAEHLATRLGQDPQHTDLAVLTEMMVRNARRAWIFTGALLAVTRGEPVDREPVGIAEIVAGAADDVVGERTTSNATIEWPPDLPSVWVSRLLIQATLANLFSNAIRYCAPGVVPKIVVAASRSDDVVTVSVTDNGAGIAHVDLAEVFHPFERRVPLAAKTADSMEDRRRIPSGYGLGLALCRQVVEAHGGRIWAVPGAAGGTTMTIELPAGPPDLP